ncbi:MAG: hypothetical protein Q8P49_03065 [Candidatus Liptonbacteria bacterium]|nr:hypothetical protein [Candidatus Liptonbacteria bacterium]
MMIAYSLQLKILGGCILTKAEFGSYNDCANWHYLNWIGLRFKKKHISFVTTYVVPPLVLLVAIVYQEFGRYW